MRKYSIGSRYIALVLLVAMFLSFLPAVELSVAAADVTDTPAFLTSGDDGVNMLNNGNNISMSIKVNNFGMDGLLFDYLSSFRREENANNYLWEHTGKDTCIQLYPYITRYYLGIDLKPDANDESTWIFADADGFSGGIKAANSLDATRSTTDIYGHHSTYGTVQRTILPEVYKNYTDYVYDSSDIGANDTPYVRLYPRGYKYDEAGNSTNYAKGRAWIKLTTFENTQKVDDVRYAVIVYRLPHGVKNSYDDGYTNFGVTVNSMDERAGNCAKYAAIDTAGGNQWQYAIIDLMGRGTKDDYRIVSGTNVNEVYLQAPFTWSQNGSGVGSALAGTGSDMVYMDIAAVGYFPYYGDAEQFAFYGLTLGCQQKYFADDNAGFSLRNNSRTYDSSAGWVNVKSLPTFYNNNEFLGARPFGVDTYNHLINGTNLQDLQALTDVLNPNSDGSKNTLFQSTGTTLFGSIKGQAALGLVEAQLGENGQPVYKESVVHYIAAYLRNQLMTIPEYPSDNYGWRNYSYIAGTSTTGATNEALFGKNELGQPIDLATALCNAIGIEKGAAITSGVGGFGNAGNYDYSRVEDNCYFGTYAKTIAHKDELVGTWNDCKDNIHTWHDAAYFLLHNLYVSETDVADTTVDGYGEYEADYQSLILPQIQYTQDGKTSTPYFFDSGYAYYTDIDDESTWSSALTFNKNDHTITLNGDADGVALFSSPGISSQNQSCWFPFLPTSGNNPAGETNTPYYCHDGAFGRKEMGTTYRSRDFNYSLSGNGYFAYEPDLYFNFQGDDDVYVYINGQLVVDIGGTHGATSYNMALDDYVDWAKGIKYNGDTYRGKTYANLSEADKARVDALCLVTGGVYSFDFFYMERHGVGSNLRIMTNMKIMESGLDVDKRAWQNGIEVKNNGIVNVDEPIEYGFSITNNSDGKLYDLSFSDDIIGIKLDPENGLQVTGNITNSFGAQLTPANLVITVDGYDENGDPVDTVNVSCSDNKALTKFLHDLSSSGTQTGDEEQDYDQLYSGSGLWKDATVTIRGIYYRMTNAQKEVISFTNSVEGAGFVKVAGENGGIEDSVLRGIAKHTVYQPGQPAYYQWVGHPIVIESERLYDDLISGNVVDSASDLPLPGNMILIPSDSSGLEIAAEGISNVPGGDVYLKVNFSVPGSHMVYVTILDSMNPDYVMTVPITVYALGGKDSIIVLDYGLDTYLTEDDALFEYELDAAAGNVSGSLLGIADDTISPSYREYDTGKIETAVGQIANGLTLVNGTYDGSTGTHGSRAVYELEQSVYLDHNKPWVIEWRGKNESALLFSSMKTSDTGNTYIYTNGGTGIFIGEDAPEHFTATSSAGDVYNNYGLLSSKVSASVVKTYALINKPDGAGGNTIYLYVDGTKVGAMTGYHQGSTAYTKDTAGKATNADWLNGRDFNFTHMGTTGHGLDGVYEFIRVYENGYQLTHYKWQMPENSTAVDKVINSVNTGNTGYVQNDTTYMHYTVSSSGNHKNYWQLAEPVTLAHDESWEISLTLEDITGSTVIMSAQDTTKANSTHIYFYPLHGKMIVHMGYKRPSGGSHTNYGADILKVLPTFDMADKHTYVLKNHVLPTGENMVHLYVDSVHIGPLNTQYLGGAEVQVENSTGISGLDFTFHYIGCDAELQFGLFDIAKIHDLEVSSKTTLSNVYEWIPGADSMVSKVATDVGGNQIVFDKADNGRVEFKAEGATDPEAAFVIDGKGLKFEINDFLESRYTAYIAMAIHEVGYVPSRVDSDEIDIGRELQLYKKVTVLPANVVYYEDDFPTIHYCGTQVDTFTELTQGLVTSRDDFSDTKYLHTGSSIGMTQSPDQDRPYGSDDAYRNDFAVSGGSVHTIAINNDGPLAWFEFTGRGFEISARTNADLSGMALVEVYEKGSVSFSNGSPVSDYSKAVALIPVVSDFDNGNEIDGFYDRDNGGAETIYQVPLLRYDDTMVDIDGFTPGVKDYVVVISGTETFDDYVFDSELGWIEGEHQDSYLYLDGIRIYYPIGGDVSYNEDGTIVYPYGDKNDAVFEEIRNHIIDGNILVCEKDSAGVGISSGTVTWTEKFFDTALDGNSYQGNKVSSVDDYLLGGPNNEVYVDGTFTNGALAFYVRDSVISADSLLDIGVRAIDMGHYFGAASTGMKANLRLGVVDGDGNASWMHLATVSGGTEQYYSVPWQLCPTETLDGAVYYQVVIKAESFCDEIPAMVSFSNIRRSSTLMIKTDVFVESDQVASGEQVSLEGGSQSYELMNDLSCQMSAVGTIPMYEAAAGAGFTGADQQTQGAIVPQYPTLSFEDEVKYNIYFSMEGLEGVSLRDMGLITFGSNLKDGTMADAVDVIPGAWSNSQSGYYMVRTHGIPAAKMGDTVYFKVYAKLADGSYVYSDTFGYNAVAYANDQLGREGNEDLKSLVVAMLNYGSAAQVKFGYKTDALMNAGLTAEQKGFVDAYESGMLADLVKPDSNKLGAFVKTAGSFSNGYPTVSFEGAFAINYYFTPAQAVDGDVTMYYWDLDTYNSADRLTMANASGIVTMTEWAGEYHGAYTGIPAKSIDDTVFVAVVYESNGVICCSGVIPYSLGVYCRECINGDDASMQALAMATAVYGCYAEKYFA